MVAFGSGSEEERRKESLSFCVRSTVHPRPRYQRGALSKLWTIVVSGGRSLTFLSPFVWNYDEGISDRPGEMLSQGGGRSCQES